jgi:hypothetical protein
VFHSGSVRHGINSSGIFQTRKSPTHTLFISEADQAVGRQSRRSRSTTEKPARLPPMRFSTAHGGGDVRAQPMASDGSHVLNGGRRETHP